MPAQLTFGTAGATGGGFAGYKGLQPMFREEHPAMTTRWSWQRRSEKTRRDPNQWESGWSWGCRVGGGDDLSYSVIGIEVGHGFEPFSVDGAGNQSLRFIRGVSRDSGGAVLANAIVQAFTTAGDVAQREVMSAEDGAFGAPTETVAGVAHYLVAYKAGSPDVTGATVNTLISTNVDGS